MADEFLTADALGETLDIYDKLKTKVQAQSEALTNAAEVAPDVLAMAGLDRRYISETADLPPAPSAQVLATLPPGVALGGAFRPQGSM